MCCVFSAYHATAAHVKQNHNIYGNAKQSKKLLIQSQRRTWSIFAEAYEAEARDFGISCPRYTLPAIIQWHLNYERPKLSAADVDVSQDPLVLCPVTNELNATDVELSHDQSVLCHVTSSNVVDLTYDQLVHIYHMYSTLCHLQPPDP